MNPTIDNNFKHHPPRGCAAEAHAAVRLRLKECAKFIEFALPKSAGREKALALTKLEEAMFWANAGIARHSEGELVSVSIHAELLNSIGVARQAALDLCHQIEQCGASEDLTKASVMASALSAQLNGLLP